MKKLSRLRRAVLCKLRVDNCKATDSNESVALRL